MLYSEGDPIKWVVYFTDKEDLSAFKPYQWVVLDRFEHPSIRPLVDQGKQVFGYVNLGEVENYTPWFDELKKEEILLVENEDWPGSFMIDLRDYRWTKRLIEQIIPFVLFKGFNGLFLDTIDNAAFLEELDPEKYKGMKEAALKLIKTIRYNYPEIKLMVNRGLDIAEEMAPYIDSLLGEVIFTDYNFKKKSYFWNSKKEQEGGIDQMKRAKAKNPKLELLSLDYWNPQDIRTVKNIYNISEKEGFSPYVSTIELDEIIPEPK